MKVDGRMERFVAAKGGRLDEPLPPKPCQNCGKLAKPLRKGRCNTCAKWWYAHEEEKPT